MRRENHTIGVLVRETKDCPPVVRNMVFHGIISFAIFTTVTEIDDPITGLNHDLTHSKTISSRIVRYTYKTLILLPAITILLILVMDVVSILWLWAPLREPHTPLVTLLTGFYWAKRAVMEMIGISLFFLTQELCRKIIKYNDGTESLLREYQALCN
jgi:hypothetical protein